MKRVARGSSRNYDLAVGHRLSLFARWTFVCSLLAAALSPGSARADEPTAADRTTARTLALEGYVALNDKDYATAADRFSRAAKLVHAPTLLRDLARAQMGLGKLVDAHENYSTIIREGVAPDAPASWVKALADAKAEIEAIPPRLPWITITVDGPTDPVVTIDGVPIPPASLGVKRPADPGKHEIRATAPGFYTAKKVIVLREGESTSVAFELEDRPPDAKPKPEEDAKAVVTTERPDPPWRKPAVISAYAVGGAGLVLGGVTGALALSKRNQLSASPNCKSNVCGDPHKDDVARLDTYTPLATVGFIVGGAGVAVGTLLLLIEPQVFEGDQPTAGQGQSGAGISWSPYVGVGSAGLKGSF